MNLSKAFRSDSSVHSLGDSDRLKLKQSLEILSRSCEGAPGEPPYLLVPLRRPDGKTSEGTETELMVGFGFGLRTKA